MQDTSKGLHGAMSAGAVLHATYLAFAPCRVLSLSATAAPCSCQCFVLIQCLEVRLEVIKTCTAVNLQ